MVHGTAAPAPAGDPWPIATAGNQADSGYAPAVAPVPARSAASTATT